MPVSGPRKLYKIEEIQVGEDADGEGGRPIIVKMKEPIAKWLGLQQIAYDDPIFIGTFSGTGPNAGFKYIKRLGGFRHQSFKIVANTNFVVLERLRLPLGYGAPLPKIYKSLSIGFPIGVSVREFIDWIASTDKISKIAYIVTPRGVSFPISPDNYDDSDDNAGDGGGNTPQLPPGG